MPARRLLVVLAVALAVLVAIPAGSASAQTPAPGASVFDGNAMWIWQLQKAGSLSSIAKRAKAANVNALYIKSANGDFVWSQFTPAMVDYFHRQGIKVCGWAYVYGGGGGPKWGTPAQEATASAAAIKRGADCFVIDPESEYEGRYAAADAYMTKLRTLVGPDTPIGVASFPYVDFHPSLPYSVFLRPDGGSQGNLPQMYWDTIQVSPDRILDRTLGWNQLYGRPVYPIGQIYLGEGRSSFPPPKDIRRFRQLSKAYGLTGTSWWEWSDSSAAGFRAATGAPGPALPARTPPAPTVSRGAAGDWVVWAQEHLNGAGHKVSVTGRFGAQTETAVRQFQAASKLPATGKLDPTTWAQLNKVTPVPTHWARRSGGPASAAAVGDGSAPDSASLPAVRDELAGTPK